MSKVKSPIVSVIMPVYNHEKFVSKSIKSVLDQTYNDLELIIINNGSTDNSISEIKSFKDQRIVLLDIPINDGVSKAINLGLKKSKGKYIAFTCSDDIWMTNKLEKQIAYLKNNHQIGMLFSKCLTINDDDKKFFNPKDPYCTIFNQPNKNRFQWLNFFFYSGNCLLYPSAIMTREVFNKVGYHNIGFNQLHDLDYWVRTCFHFNIHILEENLVHFRVHQNNKNSSSPTAENSTRSLWQYQKILEHYLKIPTNKMLAKIFPDNDINSKLPLPINLAHISLMVNSPKYIHQRFALDVLYNYLVDHQFSVNEFVKLSGSYDLFFISQINQLQSENDILVPELKELHQIKKSLVYKFLKYFI